MVDLLGNMSAHPHISISSSSSSSSGFDDFHLSIHTDMATVAKAMACPESGLEVRDRMWLKITIANAFIGMSGTLHFVQLFIFLAEFIDAFISFNKGGTCIKHFLTED